MIVSTQAPPGNAPQRATAPSILTPADQRRMNSGEKACRELRLRLKLQRILEQGRKIARDVSR